jgi:hypothetical protein
MNSLSSLAAYDMGYVRGAQLADRIESTLTSVEALERHEGHLLNWYDTENLAPLAPRYVSTVDSGNWAGALMALSVGLREIAESADDDERACAGAADTAGGLAEALAALEHRPHLPIPIRSNCRHATRELDLARSRRDGRDATGSAAAARRRNRGTIRRPWGPRIPRRSASGADAGRALASH